MCILFHRGAAGASKESHREDEMRFGIIGAGRIGKIHAGNVAAHRDCKVSYVADADAGVAASLAAATGAKVATIEEILESAEVDAIAICAPTDMHADLIERGARAKKAIFCEKPVDLDADRSADGRL